MLVIYPQLPALGRSSLYPLAFTRFNFWEEIIILTKIYLYAKLSYYTPHLLLATHPSDKHRLEINPNLTMEKKMARNVCDTTKVRS